MKYQQTNNKEKQKKKYLGFQNILHVHSINSINTSFHLLLNGIPINPHLMQLHVIGVCHFAKFKKLLADVCCPRRISGARILANLHSNQQLI
jgi:hypothetical protein